MLPVRVTPKGGRDCLLPFQAGDTEIKLKVSAPPEDGKANAAVIRLLSEVLGIPKSRISVARGESSRTKQIAVQCDNADEMLNRLARAISAGATCFNPVSR